MGGPPPASSSLTNQPAEPPAPCHRPPMPHRAAPGVCPRAPGRGIRRRSRPGVRPLATRLRISDTGMRMPRITASPARIAGSAVIRSKPGTALPVPTTTGLASCRASPFLQKRWYARFDRLFAVVFTISGKPSGFMRGTRMPEGTWYQSLPSSRPVQSSETEPVYCVLSYATPPSASAADRVSCH